MTFLEFFNLKNITSTNTGSLSKNEREHRHQKSNYAINQVSGKTKKPYGVARYLIKKDDDINKCKNTKIDVPISIARAMELRKYGTPTKEEPEKAIKQTGVYIIMNPDGSYKLSYKGEPHGKSKIFR
jgi:hypothetical protein